MHLQAKRMIIVATLFQVAISATPRVSPVLMIVSPDPSLDLLLSAGWNLVSFPCLPDDPSFSNILGGVGFYQVLTWGGASCVVPTDAEVGIGYWVLVLQETTVTIPCDNLVESYELDLPAGWSMIGSVTHEVDADTVFPGWYQLLTWDGTSYITATTLEPGRGYWVLLLQPEQIRVTAYGNVTVQRAKALIETNPNIVLVDVRTPEEFAAGHIDGSINLCGECDPQQLLDNLHPDDEILLYCRTGRRSANAMQMLNDNGYDSVYNMLGGIEAWLEIGYPVV